MTGTPFFSTEDLINNAADLFTEPEAVIGEYGNGVIQLISNLIGLSSEHFDLVLLLVQREVRVQQLTSKNMTLVKKIEVVWTENTLLKAEIEKARNEIRELV